MMAKAPIRDKDEAIIDECVAAFETKQDFLKTFLSQIALFITSSPRLRPLVHTVRPRLKGTTNLRDKLNRKLEKSKKEKVQFPITPANLLETVNDLVGIRILHLSRGQIVDIDAGLREIIEEQRLKLLEVFARTWDDQSRQYFERIGIKPEVSPNMYTSVHYVVGSGTRTPATCEIQVRTLMEEVWGEIDHMINYPHPIDDVACRAQLKTLAHTVMGATANVEGIMESVAALKRK